MLTNIAKAIPHTNGLYLAYNKSIATDSKKKFPKTTHCMTTHSLAYQATIKSYKLKLGEFTYRSITEKIDYDKKIYIVSLIREFCLSKYTSFKDFASSISVSDRVAKLCNKYLDLMSTGNIECTHDFYLKLFHIYLVSGDITYEPFDFILLDEAGDTNEVTLEIFKLLPSAIKVAVGDKSQNIYTFNHTINAFPILQDEGATIFKMTKSFRVADYIASGIEKFCKSYLDPTMDFKGVTVASTVVKTSAYITRTNSALISRMIELNVTNTPYGLVRKATEIFRVPLMLVGLKHKGFISEPAYKHLQNDVDDWYSFSNINKAYKTALSYIGALYPDDIQLQQAIRLINRHGKISIMQAYTEARKHERSDQNLILATAHSCKGSEYSEVTIADDLNYSIEEPVQKILSGASIADLTEEEQESLRLYYVGISRCSIKLNNAIWI